jgi:hypothetical protein
MACRLLLVLLLALASGAGAQDADTLTAEPLPDSAAATETAPEDTATPVPETPTRRPTRRPTRTVTATAVDTPTPTSPPADTPTAAPPTAVPTRTAPRVATPTLPIIAVTYTPTATIPAPLFVRLASGAADVGMLNIGLGALLAMLAAWLGARIAGGRERRDRHRARRALATAMLLELRRIDAVLRRVVALDTPSSFPSLEHPIMEGALRDLTLFDAETAARIAQFHGALRGIQHEIADYRDNPLRWAGRLGELNQIIKGRAAAACRAVPALIKVLERSGGAPPPQLHETGGSSSSPSDLPPPPFGGADGDDWTL